MVVSTFLEEHNLPKEKFIDFDTVPSWAGVALTKILSSVGDKRDDLEKQLFQTRIGNKKAESYAKNIIDSRFGEGFFDYLMQVDLYNEESLISLHEKLGLRQS